ncbi:hypothetical protein KUCAC02_033508 [Chaenocephalus aceratus]|nr:hypothetical protein KUCAC02_033508 [Chaenocephalus aceratus]
MLVGSQNQLAVVEQSSQRQAAFVAGIDSAFVAGIDSAFVAGNMRSALNDAAAAKKIKPDHLKALIRGAQSCIELRSFAEGVQWCDEGLKVHPTDKKLQELRATADKHKRAAERDSRKAKIREKKLHGEKEALLAAITDRGIKLFQTSKPRHRESDGEEESSSAALSQLSLDCLSSQEATGARVFLDEQHILHWPVLFLYPEHQQTDFISAFCENDCFVNHLALMFGEELPPWDADRKYHPQNLQVCYNRMHDLYSDGFLIRNCGLNMGIFDYAVYYCSFIVVVKGSPFWEQFSTRKKIRGL